MSTNSKNPGSRSHRPQQGHHRTSASRTVPRPKTPSNKFHVDDSEEDVEEEAIPNSQEPRPKSSSKSSTAGSSVLRRPSKALGEDELPSVAPRSTALQSQSAKTPDYKSMSAVKGLYKSASKPLPAVKGLYRSTPKSGPAVKQMPRSTTKTKSTTKPNSTGNGKSIIQKLQEAGRPAVQLASDTVNRNAVMPTARHGTSHSKKATATQSSAAHETPKISTKGTTNTSDSTIQAEIRGKPARNGLRDPYEVPSDSDASDSPLRRPITRSIASLGGPSSKNAKTSNKALAPDGQPATPQRPTSRLAETRPKAQGSASSVPALGSSLPASTYRSRPRTPANIPAEAQIVSLVSSSSNEPTSARASLSASKPSSISRPRTPAQIPADAKIISVDGSSDHETSPSRVASYQRPAIKSTPASHKRAAAQIPVDAQIISLSEPSSSSSSESDWVAGRSPDLDTPVRPSAKAIGKRSHHSVNSHLEFVNEETLNDAQVSPGPSFTIKNSTGIFPVYRRGDTPAERKQHGSASSSGGPGQIQNGKNKDQKQEKGLQAASNATPLRRHEIASSSQSQRPSSPLDHVSTVGNVNHGSRGHVQVSKSRANRQGSSVTSRATLGHQSVENNTKGLSTSEKHDRWMAQKEEFAHPIEARSSQNESTVAKAARTSSSGTKTRPSPEAAIEHVKKMTAVKSKKKPMNQPIPKSFLAESKSFDDEYHSSSSADELSDSERDEALLAVPQSRAIKPRPSQGNTRSSSPSASQASVTPTNNLNRGTWESKSVSQATKFGRGYSKRVREVFSDASASELDNEMEPKPGPSKTASRSSRNPPTKGKTTKDNEVEVQSQNTIERKPWWDPWAWISKYGGTEFEFEGTTAWFSDGPFRGYIINGPYEGSYITGCKQPDDEALSKADKAALGKSSKPSDTSADLASSSDVEQDDLVDDDDDDMESIGASSPPRFKSGEPQSIPDQAMARGNSLEGLSDSQGPESFHTAPLPSSCSLSTPPRQTLSSLAQAKASERTERMERTEQYVLNGTPKHLSHRHTNNESLILSGIPRRLPNNLAPTSTPEHALLSPSIDSTTTSVLITRQLTVGSSPPSNQELAALMSSSPANQKPSPVKSLPIKPSAAHKPGRNIAVEDDEDDLEISSTEPSSGIPARLPPRTPPQPPGAQESQEKRTPLRFDHPSAMRVLNSIAERRTTRSMTEPWSASRPNYRVPGVDEITANVEPTVQIASTPSKRARETPSAKQTTTGLTDTVTKPLSKAEIVVELPELPAKKQAEYAAAVSRTDQSVDTCPVKSFEEFGDASPSVSTRPYDSDREALDFVLNKSPKWLNDFTQVGSGDASDSRAKRKLPKLSLSFESPVKKSTGRSTASPARGILTLDENSSYEPPSQTTSDTEDEKDLSASAQKASKSPKRFLGKRTGATKRKDTYMDDNTPSETSRLTVEPGNSSECIPASKRQKCESPKKLATRTTNQGCSRRENQQQVTATKPLLQSTTPIPLPSFFVSQVLAKAETTPHVSAVFPSDRQYPKSSTPPTSRMPLSDISALAECSDTPAAPGVRKRKFSDMARSNGFVGPGGHGEDAPLAVGPVGISDIPPKEKKQKTKKKRDKHGDSSSKAKHSKTFSKDHAKRKKSKSKKREELHRTKQGIIHEDGRDALVEDAPVSAPGLFISSKHDRDQGNEHPKKSSPQDTINFEKRHGRKKRRRYSRLDPANHGHSEVAMPRLPAGGFMNGRSLITPPTTSRPTSPESK